MLRVEEINRLEDLADRRLVWQSLLLQTRHANFFQSLDWLLTFWRYYGDKLRLRALLVYDGREPVGIMPLAVVPEPTRLGTVRVLTYPLHEWGTFYGPIGPQPTATLLAALNHLRATPRDWDLLELRWIDLAGSDQGRTEQAMLQAGLRPQRQAWAQSAVVEFAGTTWDEYWKSRGKKWRHNVTRLQRRLDELGPIRHERYRPGGDLAGDGQPRLELFDACLEVAHRSWQGSSTTGTTLSHPEVRDFLREIHVAAAGAGCLDVNLLYLGLRPIAFIYNYHFAGRLFGLRMGFDPEFEASGPGTVLQRLLIEDSFRRGDEIYDLGICYLRGKLPWHTNIVTSYRYSHFPRTLSLVQLLRLKRWWLDKVYGDRYVVCARIG